jgi:type IV secretory pathway VirB10-like protein
MLKDTIRRLLRLLELVTLKKMIIGIAAIIITIVAVGVGFYINSLFTSTNENNLNPTATPTTEPTVQPTTNPTISPTATPSPTPTPTPSPSPPPTISIY